MSFEGEFNGDYENMNYRSWKNGKKMEKWGKSWKIEVYGNNECDVAFDWKFNGDYENGNVINIYK